jgi:hypothetical protein
MGTASAFSLKRPGPSDMKLNSQDLEKIADLTLDCYNQNAEDFWEGTRYHDVSQNIAAMLQYIEGERPFTILDFGCGPGSIPAATNIAFAAGVPRKRTNAKAILDRGAGSAA